MNREERRQSLSERTALRRLLERLPVESVIDRATLGARLAGLERRLNEGPEDTRSPAHARLTFRGRPVVGSYGIFADFGLEATKKFSDAVALVAAGNEGPLANTGPIPGRERSKILITSTAVGSFGFELVEHREQPLLVDDEGTLGRALAQTQQLLEATAGTDDELTEVAAAIDPRIIGAVRSFLEILGNNDAICALEYADRVFAFQDVAQVRQGANRLAQENRHERTREFTGEFQGVLPKRRTFEFQLVEDGSIITGKIGPGIQDPDRLNQHLHERTTVALVETRIGNGRPGYVLTTFPAWNAERR